MLRNLLIAAGAAAALGACTQYSDAPYYGGSGYNSGYNNPNNPPGWVDRDRDGRDDRVERRDRAQQSGGYYDRYGNWHSYR